ncbi:MAG: SDR family oxidoreductase [Chloroflexi bacterium CFX4]|nr:SDR family oxidoreductase [Chloroflexi bacterium CFX4]MDL1922076.1 SDR family oxidoreductase [Chloroflexi bacterium CFX3]
MDLGLKNKVALVAAASKGLGYGVARALAREGAHLSICSRDADQVRLAGEKLTAETGAQVLAVPCDVREAAAIEAWVAQTVARWGSIDALLVNAGGPPAATFKEITDAQWQAAFELTLLSTVRMIRAALPHMPHGAAILTITSSSIKEPIERLGLSTVMRAGVAGLVKTLADELSGDGIRVNNLIPGRIDTDRVAQLDQGTAAARGISFEQARAEAVGKIPLRRLGSIDEFGAAAAFLLSPAAAYITGATLRVDGGAMRSI